MKSFIDLLCIQLILGGFAWIPIILIYALAHENKIIIGLTLLSIISDKDALYTAPMRQFMRRVIKWCTSYFPIHVHYTGNLESEYGNIYMYEPHDVFPLGIFGLYDSICVKSKKFVKVLASSAIFRFPFAKQLWYCCDIDTIDKPTFMSYAEESMDIIITPGGVREVYENFVCKNRKDVVYIPIKNRYGFIKIALQHKKNVVPIVAYGQKNAYYTYNIFPSKLIEKLFSIVKFVPLFFVGRFKMPIGAPFRTQIHVVVGEQIKIEDNDNIETYHKRVCEQLVKLYDKHKHEYGHGDAEMVII